MVETLTPILSSIEFQMSLLLFIALGGYLLASRINQSAVIGEILVGLLVGPSVLGWITYTDFVHGLAHLGAIILLFVVGLEFRLEELAKVKYAVIGIFGVIVPWVAGYFLAKSFGFDFATSLFIGTALTATSIAITANVLKEMGKLQTAAAKAIIGAAVIDDVLALLALSVTGEFISGAISTMHLFTVLWQVFAFIAVGVAVGHILITRIMERIDSSHLAKKFPELAFIFAMMVAFLYAAGAELMGLSAIVGSFIAGVSLGSVDLKHSRSFKVEADSLQVIFGAVFFVSLGIIADLKALTPAIITFSLVLTAVAVLTKVIGCGLPARLQGMSLKDSLIIGFAMSPRAEVAMIIGLIALSEGYIGQDIYVALVIMALLTTVITPLIFQRWLLKGAPADSAG